MKELCKQCSIIRNQQYGSSRKKEFLDLNNMQELKFAEQTTENQLQEKYICIRLSIQYETEN